MKGRLVQNILKSLTAEEKIGFFAKVKALPEGLVLEKVCKHLIAEATYSDRELLRKFTIKGQKRDSYLQAILEYLLTFNGLHHKDAKLANIYVLAQRLLGLMQFESCTDLIQEGIKFAGGMENFTVVVNFRELAACLPEPAHIEGMTRLEARKHLEDIALLTDLVDELELVKKDPMAEHTRQSLERIQSQAIEKEKSTALCHKAMHLYYKIMVSYHVIRVERIEAIPYQLKMVELIRDHPIAAIDPDYFLTKEIRYLSHLYQATGQNQAFKGAMNLLNDLPTQTIYAEFEKKNHRFPIVIGSALDEGDLNVGMKACSELLTLLSDETLLFTPQFRTENLYWAGNFFFAAGDQISLSKVLRELNRHPKGDFKPRHFIAYKFLRLMRAINDGDWEEVAVAVKWLRNPQACEEMTGLAIAIDFLEGLASMEISHPLEKDYESLSMHPNELKQRLEGLALLGYFDLIAWLEARAKNCSMIEVFNHRAEMNL